MRWVQQQMQTASVVNLSTGDVAVYSRGKVREAPRNEDAATIIDLDGGAVLAVADGAGGYAGAAEAAAIAIDALSNAVLEGDNRDPRPAILDGFEAANRQILELGIGACTTLVVAEITDRKLRCYHTGDSALVWCGSRGRLKYQTMPHSPVGYGVAAGLLDAEDALLHADLSVVSNLVGCEDMRVEIGSRLPLADRDTLVLASDGLFDNLHVDEVVSILRRGRLQDAADELATLALTRMDSSDPLAPSKPDDLTFIVFRLRN